MKALSIRQPWAALILHGGLMLGGQRAFKDVENRTWSTSYSGPLLIHASKTLEKIDDSYLPRGVSLPPKEEILLGGLVGVVELTHCTDFHNSPWYAGDVAWVVRNPKPLPFMPYKGQLGLFDISEYKLPEDTWKQLKEWQEVGKS